jgi:hypothetical protein
LFSGHDGSSHLALAQSIPQRAAPAFTNCGIGETRKIRADGGLKGSSFEKQTKSLIGRFIWEVRWLRTFQGIAYDEALTDPPMPPKPPVRTPPADVLTPLGR